MDVYFSHFILTYVYNLSFFSPREYNREFEYSHALSVH